MVCVCVRAWHMETTLLVLFGLFFWVPSLKFLTYLLHTHYVFVLHFCIELMMFFFIRFALFTLPLCASVCMCQHPSFAPINHGRERTQGGERVSERARERMYTNNGPKNSYGRQKSSRRLSNLLIHTLASFMALQLLPSTSSLPMSLSLSPASSHPLPFSVCFFHRRNVDKKRCLRYFAQQLKQWQQQLKLGFVRST